MATQASQTDDLRVELISDPADFEAAYACICNTFGHQTADALWMGMNPGWDTPEGKKRHIADLVKRWTATREAGNVMYLKASLPDGTIAGVAIWLHASLVPGRGEPPSKPDVTTLYPNDEPMQRWLSQSIASLHAARVAALQEKAETAEAAAAGADDAAVTAASSLMILDLCVVDPKFQRRGIASKLVRWGLDEARRRGGVEATTEASAMGRHVYQRLGFQQVGGEIEYVVDEEFKGRNHPSNIFMRTGSTA